MKRVIIQIIMLFTLNGRQRAKILKKLNVFKSMGNDIMIQSRKIPLYPNLIKFGNNIRLASNVLFITHDVIHNVFNNLNTDSVFNEKMGCINIEDNVFIGANTLIMYDVNIGSNTIIAAGSIITKDLESGYVWAGVPAKKIGTFNDVLLKRKSVFNMTDNELWEAFYGDRK